MRKMSLVVIILGGLAASPGRLMAGEGPAFEAGSAVRVTVQKEVFVGRLSAIEDDALLIAREGKSDLRLSRRAIDRLEVSAGRRSTGQRLLSGAGYGFLSLAIPGVVLGLASGSDPADWPPNLRWSAGEKGVFSGACLGVVGAVLGAITGVAKHGERWQTVRAHGPAGLSLNVEPARQGAGLSVRYAF
jgi:hypothetical protein